MSQTDTDDQPFCFASLGLVVIDEIRFPNQQPLENVLGGSGAYGWFYLIYLNFLF